MFELLAELGACRGYEFDVEVGGAGEAPASVGCLGEEHPRTRRDGRVVGCVGDDSRELGYGGELLVAVQSAGIGEHLHADVIAVAVDVGQRPGRKLVHERGCVLPEQGDVGDLFALASTPRQAPARAPWCRRRFLP